EDVDHPAYDHKDSDDLYVSGFFVHLKLLLSGYALILSEIQMAVGSKQQAVYKYQSPLQVMVIFRQISFRIEMLWMFAESSSLG
ncbi:MAG: hypothetical protein ACK2T7_06280, partial [Anaerolineales bacterium]